MEYPEATVLAGVICMNCGSSDAGRAAGGMIVLLGLALQFWRLWKYNRQ